MPLKHPKRRRGNSDAEPSGPAKRLRSERIPAGFSPSWYTNDELSLSDDTDDSSQEEREVAPDQSDSEEELEFRGEHIEPTSTVVRTLPELKPLIDAQVSAAWKEMAQGQVLDFDDDRYSRVPSEWRKELRFRAALKRVTDTNAAPAAPAAAKAFGVSDEVYLRALSYQAAQHDIERGGSAGTAIQRHGVRNQDDRLDLFVHAARKDIAAGKTAVEIVAFHRVTDETVSISLWNGKRMAPEQVSLKEGIAFECAIAGLERGLSPDEAIESNDLRGKIAEEIRRRWQKRQRTPDTVEKERALRQERRDERAQIREVHRRFAARSPALIGVENNGKFMPLEGYRNMLDDPGRYPNLNRDPATWTILLRHPDGEGYLSPRAFRSSWSAIYKDVMETLDLPLASADRPDQPLPILLQTQDKHHTRLGQEVSTVLEAAPIPADTPPSKIFVQHEEGEFRTLEARLRDPAWVPKENVLAVLGRNSDILEHLQRNRLPSSPARISDEDYGGDFLDGYSATQLLKADRPHSPSSSETSYGGSFLNGFTATQFIKSDPPGKASATPSPSPVRPVGKWSDDGSSDFGYESNIFDDLSDSDLATATETQTSNEISPQKNNMSKRRQEVWDRSSPLSQGRG